MVRPRHRQRRRRARGTRAAPRKRRDAARAPTTSRSSAGHWTRPARPQTRQAGPGAHQWGRRHEEDHRTAHPPPGVLQRRGSPCPTTHRRPTGTIPQTAWSPAYNADGHPGNGAHAAETRRPAGPNRMAPGHAGQPRATSSPTRVAGRASRTSQKLPATALATNTKGGRLPGLEARHRPRTRRQGTASAAQKTPGSTTSLRRASRKTVSGARSWPRPADLPTFSQTPALADASARAWEPIRFLHVGGDRTGGLRPRLGTHPLSSRGR